MILTRLFTASALTSLVCLLVLTLWAGFFALRGTLFSRDGLLALIATHVVLALQTCLLLPIWFQGLLRQPTTTFAYAIIALAAVPCVWVYLPTAAPRQHSSSIALACLFASGMVVRALQTA